MLVYEEGQKTRITDIGSDLVTNVISRYLSLKGVLFLGLSLQNEENTGGKIVQKILEIRYREKGDEDTYNYLIDFFDQMFKVFYKFYRGRGVKAEFSNFLESVKIAVRVEAPSIPRVKHFTCHSISKRYGIKSCSARTEDVIDGGRKRILKYEYKVDFYNFDLSLEEEEGELVCLLSYGQIDGVLGYERLPYFFRDVFGNAHRLWILEENMNKESLSNIDRPLTLPFSVVFGENFRGNQIFQPLQKLKELLEEENEQKEEEEEEELQGQSCFIPLHSTSVDTSPNLSMYNDDDISSLPSLPTSMEPDGERTKKIITITSSEEEEEEEDVIQFTQGDDFVERPNIEGNPPSPIKRKKQRFEEPNGANESFQMIENMQIFEKTQQQHEEVTSVEMKVLEDLRNKQGVTYKILEVNIMSSKNQGPEEHDAKLILKTDPKIYEEAERKFSMKIKRHSSFLEDAVEEAYKSTGEEEEEIVGELWKNMTSLTGQEYHEKILMTVDTRKRCQVIRNWESQIYHMELEKRQLEKDYKRLVTQEKTTVSEKKMMMKMTFMLDKLTKEKEGLEFDLMHERNVLESQREKIRNLETYGRKKNMSLENSRLIEEFEKSMETDHEEDIIFFEDNPSYNKSKPEQSQQLQKQQEEVFPNFFSQHEDNSNLGVNKTEESRKAIFEFEEMMKIEKDDDQEEFFEDATPPLSRTQQQQQHNEEDDFDGFMSKGFFGRLATNFAKEKKEDRQREIQEQMEVENEGKRVARQQWEEYEKYVNQRRRRKEEEEDWDQRRLEEQRRLDEEKKKLEDLRSRLSTWEKKLALKEKKLLEEEQEKKKKEDR